MLENHYSRFEDADEQALGHANDEANWISKLMFSWVNPLISKGLSGLLRTVDDLFQLPETLNVSRINDKLRRIFAVTPSLFKALHKTFGFEFYAIGILRLMCDMSGFAGPMLLNGLLQQNSDPSEFDYKPFMYAFGLFGSSIFGKFNILLN